MFGGLFKKKDNKMILGAPVKGKAVPLSEVNDPDFCRGDAWKRNGSHSGRRKGPLPRQMARSVWYLIHSMQSALYLKKGQRF